MMPIIPVIRLFKVQPTVGHEPVFFQLKMLAKNRRDREREQGHKNAVVMRGPDHWRGESFNKSRQMVKQGAREW